MLHDSIMSQTQVATENLVHVSDLVKDYDELRAVDGIGVRCEAGRDVRPTRAKRCGEDDDYAHVGWPFTGD